jgi:hypothetical protein
MTRSSLGLAFLFVIASSAGCVEATRSTPVGTIDVPPARVNKFETGFARNY